MVSWSAPEYEYKSKSKEWFWTLGILTFALTVAALLLKNFLFASFIVLSGFTVALYGVKKPQIVKYSVDGAGIKIAERFYPYETLKSFWIRYETPGKKELELITKKIIMPRLILPLGEADPNEIRSILIKVLKEEEAQESLAEIIAGRLGF